MPNMWNSINSCPTASSPEVETRSALGVSSSNKPGLLRCPDRSVPDCRAVQPSTTVWSVALQLGWKTTELESCLEVSISVSSSTHSFINKPSPTVLLLDFLKSYCFLKISGKQTLLGQGTQNIAGLIALSAVVNTLTSFAIFLLNDWNGDTDGRTANWNQKRHLFFFFFCCSICVGKDSKFIKPRIGEGWGSFLHWLMSPI